jgi:Trypsin-like serine proteases, typically periplasmic, contain C-terminal PDZ domain
VLTDDGRQATAKIIGTDEQDDLAVIKVDGLPNLTAATFAKSSNLVVGQAVVAVGAPLGLSNTVTSGIVSNTARPVRAGDNDQSVFNAVQTDADQPRQFRRPAGQHPRGSRRRQHVHHVAVRRNEGLGFAIPSATTRTVFRQLKQYGMLRKQELGISWQTITPEMAAALSLARDYGVIVSDVWPGGPAQAAA